MLQFPYPDLCEFQLLGRPRRAKEGDLKVRTHGDFEGSPTQSSVHGREVSRWTGSSVWLSHGALQHQACSSTLDPQYRIMFGGTLNEAVSSQHLLSMAPRHLNDGKFMSMCSELPGTK